MSEDFINFLESKLDDVNDKIQILSEYVKHIQKQFPDIRKMSFEDLMKIEICKNFKYDCCFITIGDGSFDSYDKITIRFNSDSGKIYSVDALLKDKYGYTFTGRYTNGAYNIGKYGEECNAYTCLLNSNDDKEFRKFLLDNNLKLPQERCFCVRCKDCYVIEDCGYDKKAIFKHFVSVDGAEYSRYIRKVKIFKNGEIELID